MDGWGGFRAGQGSHESVVTLLDAVWTTEGSAETKSTARCLSVPRWRLHQDPQQGVHQLQ